MTKEVEERGNHREGLYCGNNELIIIHDSSLTSSLKKDALSHILLPSFISITNNIEEIIVYDNFVFEGENFYIFNATLISLVTLIKVRRLYVKN